MSFPWWSPEVFDNLVVGIRKGRAGGKRSIRPGRQDELAKLCPHSRHVELFLACQAVIDAISQEGDGKVRWDLLPRNGRGDDGFYFDERYQHIVNIESAAHILPHRRCTRRGAN